MKRPREPGEVTNSVQGWRQTLSVSLQVISGDGITSCNGFSFSKSALCFVETMLSRTHVPGSPSVTLEKGVPRLRPVPLRETRRGPVQDGRRFITPSEAERRATAILALIAFVILLVVLSTLYVITRNAK